jgi:acetoin utilization deacetylase AcuC-like enzyme
LTDVAIYMHPDCLAHQTGAHPESPERLTAIWDALQAAPLPPNVHWPTPTPAAVEQLLRVHHPALVEEIRQLCARGGGMMGLDTVVSRRSYDAALLAAGSAVAAARYVVEHPGARAFALPRPPGHHATPGEAMGFCLFNNVAIAAMAALEDMGLERVAIVDYDVHNGNGTQAAFARDGRVLFCSLHQFPHHYQPLPLGPAEAIGDGPGRGLIVNVPLPPGSGDAAYRAAFARVVEPALRRFRPELILVSAGFDAHWADPLDGNDMRVSTTGFVDMTRQLAGLADELCGGRLALTLEGGYDLTALATTVVAIVASLSGEAPPDVLGPPPGGAIEHVEPVLDRVKRIHGL